MNSSFSQILEKSSVRTEFLIKFIGVTEANCSNPVTLCKPSTKKKWNFCAGVRVLYYNNNIDFKQQINMFLNTD